MPFCIAGFTGSSASRSIFTVFRCPANTTVLLPAVTVAGTGVLTLGFDGSVYRFVLPRRKALTCRFPVLAAKYRLSVYGSDFPEDRLYEEGSDGSDVAFALAGSREAFINVGLKTDAAADILTFRTILADIERSMYDE